MGRFGDRAVDVPERHTCSGYGQVAPSLSAYTHIHIANIVFDEAGAQGLCRRDREDTAPALLSTGNIPLEGQAR